MAEQLVFSFKDQTGKTKEENLFLLGNKGCQLAEMTRMGLPVPQGFTIATGACRYFFANNNQWPNGLMDQIKQKTAELEMQTQKKFGDTTNPLLVSVRSGSFVSMPGMMETILNLGLNNRTVEGLAKKTGNPRMAYDSYRRLIQMFSDVVLNVSISEFEKKLFELKKEKKIEFDYQLSANDLKQLVLDYQKIVLQKTGNPFPQDAFEQLRLAINAVFDSFNSERALSYRRINKLPGDAGTGVTVQAMVFGNTGETSGTGVAFTRNPSTGENTFYGEYLVNAQGEDVVAGIRTPQPIAELQKTNAPLYAELNRIRLLLEKHYRDMQDFEFTVETKKLFLLQTRSGKRTAQAGVKIAVDMANEKLITKEEAVLRVNPDQLNQLLHKQLNSSAKKTAVKIASGLATSPGAAVGKAVFSAGQAVHEISEEPGAKVILVRPETSPEDIEGMNVAQGILTSTGGLTCFVGETIILTNQGFMSIQSVFENIEKGKRLSILSFDSKNLKSQWKKIVAVGKNKKPTIQIGISSRGITRQNLLTLTPDHKMYFFENRKLVKKPITEILAKKGFVTVVDKIPTTAPSIDFGSKFIPELPYLVGAIFTDGHLALRKTKGTVIFTQKQTVEKEDFIAQVKQNFQTVFGYGFSLERVKCTNSVLRGRQISGSATDFIASRKEAAYYLAHIRENIEQFIFSLDETGLWNFLAGVIDGDGSFHDNRIHIFTGKGPVTKGVVLASLRLGLLAQVTKNRTIAHIQLLSEAARVLQFTKRVKHEMHKTKYGRKLFAVEQLFDDISLEKDLEGKIKQAIKGKRMVNASLMLEKWLSIYPKNSQEELKKILNSDVHNNRVDFVQDSGENIVYNIEVDSTEELDKNFVVFTNNYTPVLVSNSHAAVVARGMGKCCISGCSQIQVNEHERFFTVKTKEKELKIKEGDFISLDGSTGEVFLGSLELSEPTLSGDFETLMSWADSFRKLEIRANADTPKDAKKAREFGAQGIGLCRTEHMFFQASRIKAVREMILADNVVARKLALDKLLPFQRADFEELFTVMNKQPVIIRLLDPPLHEFLPKEEKELQEISREMNVPLEKLRRINDELHEFNPMLGFRGVRLGIVYPEINEMQIRAIFEAALNVSKKGVVPVPEIEIPLVGFEKEFLILKEMIEKIAVQTKAKGKIAYKIGSMIEVPRGALMAGELAKHSEFFSFGTNDLTQTTLGFSRDDSGRFIPLYLNKKIFETDPFVSIDQDGVGQLMKMAVDAARKTNPDINIGICGEHGGDPESVEFCHKIGLNNVSCSPYRVPIARLAAAHAALKEQQQIPNQKSILVH
ncbi:MAG: putative PEP-binding protein [Candidatus Micrarchaeota archaeon]